MNQPYLSYSTERVSATSRLFKRAEVKNAEILRTKTIEENRAFKQKLADVRPILPTVKTQALDVGGVACELITRDETLEDKLILYIHGGSWAFGNLDTARPMGVLLAELTTCAVVVVDYRLSPEHPYPAGLDDCYAVYTAALREGFPADKIALFGDSAGGNLALCMAHLMRIKKQPMPAAIALASPVTDLTKQSELWLQQPDLIFSRHEGVERDIFDLYARGYERTMPTISPKYGDLSGFPPILIHTGEDEALCNDNIAFAKAAYEVGVSAHCKVWKEMFHDFTIVGITLKESRNSLREIAEMIENRLA